MVQSTASDDSAAAHSAAAQIEQAARQHYGWVVACLMSRLRDLDLAEDAAQQAFVAAVSQWPREGVPQTPRAWLLNTARRKAIDALRRHNIRRLKGDELRASAQLDRDAQLERDARQQPDSEAIDDDMLRLIFTCCHPSLSQAAQVALTLKTIVGLTSEQIARAFVLPIPTVAQRIVRAKGKIRRAGIPYRVPSPRDFPGRLHAVLQVIYLVFNEGYSVSGGEVLLETRLCEHAISLCNDVHRLLPTENDVLGLLALMVLQHARRDARIDEHGDLVLLCDQDRDAWHRDEITRGKSLAEAAARGGAGPYALQAAIAALHSEAVSSEETDWPQIVVLYDLLLSATGSPIVALNRAVAVAMAFGVAQGLALVDVYGEQYEEALEPYYLFHATRADFLRRLGKHVEAAAAYRRAVAGTRNGAEIRFLRKRLAQCDAASPATSP